MLGLVGVNLILEVGIFLASAAANAAQLAQPFLRLVEVVHLKVKLAQILVGTLVIGVNGQCFLVVLQRLVHLAELAIGKAEVVERIGIIGRFVENFFQEADGALVVLG